MNEITTQMEHMNMMRGMCTHQDLRPRDFNVCFAFSCRACHEVGYGSCYICVNGCCYEVHKKCLTASPVAYHCFFEHLSFTLQRQELPNTNNLCTACGMAVKGLSYMSNYQGITIYLHPCCMNMPHCIEADECLECNDSGNTLFLKERLFNVECDYCERMTIGGYIQGWAYVSGDQEFAYHLKCMKKMMYEDWSKHPQMEDGSRCHIPYDRCEFDEGLVPSVAPRNNIMHISPVTPVASAQRPHPYHNVSQPQNNLPLTTRSTATRPRSSAQRPQPDSNVRELQNNLAMTIQPTLNRPVASAQLPQPYRDVSQPQNDLPLATMSTTTRPTGQRRQIPWNKWVKAVAIVFVRLAVGDLTGAVISTIESILDN